MQGVCERLATPWQNNWSLPGGMLEQNEASCNDMALQSALVLGSITLPQFDIEPLLANPHPRCWTFPVNLPIARPNPLPVPPVRMTPYPRSGFSPEPVS
ncbi:MAG TPA: hypothetical protein VIK39_02295 [Candidatus Angelobacter sp.]